MAAVKRGEPTPEVGDVVTIKWGVGCNEALTNVEVTSETGDGWFKGTHAREGHMEFHQEFVIAYGEVKPCARVR